MLTQADFVVLTKIDMVSQAELEIIRWQIGALNPRALMIADIALICDSPIVLVDEIENAGIDKQRALSLLQSREKLVLVVTHDPHTALMAERRLVMSGGAVKAVITRSEREAALYDQLSIEYARSQRLQTLLRKGELLA